MPLTLWRQQLDAALEGRGRGSKLTVDVEERLPADDGALEESVPQLQAVSQVNRSALWLAEKTTAHNDTPATQNQKISHSGQSGASMIDASSKPLC